MVYACRGGLFVPTPARNRREEWQSERSKQVRSSSLSKTLALRATLAVALALAVAAVVAATQANPARAAFPGENGKIAFASRTSSNGPDDIFTINPDGTGRTQLTFDEGFENQPDFSPDGNKIVFDSLAFNEDVEIFTMNADGSEQTNLTNNDVNESSPVFSPDGNKIAFTSEGDATNNPEGDFEIFTMNVDGTGLTNVTNNGADVLDASPEWSSTDKIAYVSRDSSSFNRNNIFTINPDGTEPTNLTDDRGENSSPDWSPDGTRIVFQSDFIAGTPTNPEGDQEIFTMNADGTGLVQLTANVDLDDEEPAFSPDGNQIAFESFGARPSNPDGDLEIFTVNADGSGEVNVTNNDEAFERNPDWGPEQNQPPVANDDAFSVKEDQSLSINAPGVLLNDSDPEGDPLTASLVTSPANGTLTLNPDGSFTYEPNRNFNGTDTFSYKSTNDANDSNTATATITVEPVKEKNKKNKHKKKDKGKKGKGKGKGGGGGGGISQGSS